MRERCGGQGFLAANMFGEGLAAAHAALTAEGDNRVLMIKVVKDMLMIFQKTPMPSTTENLLRLIRLKNFTTWTPF